MWRYFLLFIFLIILCGCNKPNRYSHHAVILQYHRFGEDNIPLTNVRIKQFEQQLNILSAGGYHVLPVSTIINRLRQGKVLPEKTY